MRIISKFHDYYDVGMKSGHDDSLLMIRNTESSDDIFKINNYYHKVSYPINKEFSINGYEQKIIIVMGKCYPLIILHKSKNKTFVNETTYHYSYDSFMNEIKDSFIQLKDYIQKNYSRDLYKFFHKNYGNFTEVQLNDKCPIHVFELTDYRNTYVERFPRLQNYHFAKVIPPMQMFQELSMWYGNIAAPDLCPVTLTEKDRIAQHGFDKWSFRKMPSKV